jgi:hypothetical protein
MMPNFLQVTIRGIVVLAICALTLSACSQPPKDTSAASMLPNLAGYTISDVADLRDAIAKVAGGSALLTGQPELTALVAGVNGLVSCYQKAGAIEGRTYVKNADPTTAGVLIIANRNALTNPANIVSCVAPGMGAQSIMIQPCAKVYTLDKDNNQFYIAYAGTNNEMCSAFCSNLGGCQ